MEFMQLNTRGQPQEISKIANVNDWNFTGRPITEVVETRIKLQKEMNQQGEISYKQQDEKEELDKETKEKDDKQPKTIVPMKKNDKLWKPQPPSKKISRGPKVPLNPKEKFRQFVEDLMNEESDDEEEEQENKQE